MLTVKHDYSLQIQNKITSNFQMKVKEEAKKIIREDKVTRAFVGRLLGDTNKIPDILKSLRCVVLTVP